MCGRKFGLILALILLCGAWSFASPAPVPAGSVVLSQDEAAQQQAAMERARAALEASSAKIAEQSRALTKLSILCGALVIVDLGAVGLAIYEAVRK